MACGLPVAAYPVVGPVDVVEHGKTGCLSEDLREAAIGALAIDRQQCLDFARRHSWRRATEQFIGNLVPART
jgi:glycosyltransferase involved in cell wall biosynthesis